MSKFSEVYKKLNNSQKEAVDTIDGPLLVIAGPGTGKTTLLTARIANILNKTDINPSNILALTFTESGVKAMKNKLIELIGSPAYFVNINTFHSFSSGIIQEYSEKFDEALELLPLSDIERVQIFRKILDENDFTKLKNFKNPYYYLNDISKSISDLKREGVDIKEFEKLIKVEELELEKLNIEHKKKGGKKTAIEKLENEIVKQKDLLKISSIYQEMLAKIGRYDYEDMISFVLNRLKIDEAFRLDIQEKYQFVLIDEYQDTNSAQNQLILELVSYWGQEANIFTVGDDEQAIYRFQGASLENILTFKSVFPNAKVIVLNSNYRSTQNIIDSSRNLIANNSQNINNYIPDIIKDYQSALELSGEKIKLAEFTNGAVENYYLATDIQDKINAGVNPNEIAIIVRENKDIEDIQDLFDRLDIKYDSISAGNILKDGSILKLINLFFLIKSIRENEEVEPELYFTVMNYDFLNLNYFDVLKFSMLASKFGGYREAFIKLSKHIQKPKTNANQLKVIQESSYVNKIGFEILDNPDAILDFFLKLTKWSSSAENNVFTKFFEEVINQSRYLNFILNSGDRIDNLAKLNTLFDEIKRLNNSDKTLNLSSFIEGLGLMRENNISLLEREIGLSKNGVKLITAHKAKGLEFDFVYIAKATDKKWGKKKDSNKIKLPKGIIKFSQIEDDQKIEDQRRLFYVALTRARKGLTISYSQTYSTTNESLNAPAMFINELRQDLVEKIDSDKFSAEFRSKIDESILLPSRNSTIDQNRQEAEFIKHLLSKFSLSVTALNTYLECGYKFKINNLFRVPRAKNDSMIFGTVIHSALRKYFEKYKNSNKEPNLDYLLDCFNNALIKEVQTEEEIKAMKMHGKKVLTNYYEKYKASFDIPIYMEFAFGRGFHKVFLDDIELNGKVDKIELINAEKKTVRVVDYKTGRAKSKNEILGKTKNSDTNYLRQLLFYKLLAELDNNFNLQVSEGELDFVEHGKKQRLNYSDFDLVDLKKEIRQAIVDMRSNKFERTTHYKNCDNCDFRNHCWPDGVPKS